MDAAQIRTELLKKGLNYARISDILDVTSVAVSGVVHRNRRSHRIATAIATALDTRIELVFPDIPSYHRPYMPDAEKQEVAIELSAKLRNLRLTGS